MPDFSRYETRSVMNCDCRMQSLRITKQVMLRVCALIKLFGRCGCPGGHQVLFQEPPKMRKLLREEN